MRAATKLRSVPRVRWVHVDADGEEHDHDCEPADVPSICVRQEDGYETTRTYFNDGEPAPPPGRGWIMGQRLKTGTQWYRRRWL